MSLIAECTGTYRVEVECVVSFYAFFSSVRKGEIIVRLCDDIVDRHAGIFPVARAFSDALGIAVGDTTNDNLFSLELTPCIGMCDQAPAALINQVVVTNLTPAKVKGIVRTLKKTRDPKALVSRTGDGNNGHRMILSMVKHHIRQAGPVLLNKHPAEKGLHLTGDLRSAVRRECR